MSVGRAILSSLIALSMAGCGGGGSGGGASTGGGNTGGGGGNTGTSPCSYASRADWARQQINEWYLFPNGVNLGANPSSFNSLQDYIDALVRPSVTPAAGGTGGPLERAGLTYITSIAEENALINSGSSAGFGIRLSYETDTNRVFVVEAFESAPGYAAGMDRGTQLLAIEGRSVGEIMASQGPAGVSDALGPTQAGVTRSITFRTAQGAQVTTSITKADYPLDPVSDRYGIRILNDGNEQVGYVNLRTFIVADAAQQLRDGFAQFRAAGITKIILDFRYNGGGLVSVGDLLTDLLLAKQVGNISSRMVLRPSKASENETTYINSQPQSITATRVAVIGREGTASASELVANNLIPYLGNNLALVGENTFGKPVGQFAFDRSACDDRLRAIAFKTVNAAGNGEYYGGLLSVIPNSCAARDDYAVQLGDPQEASISKALDFLAGRSCTPIAAKADGITAQTLGSRSRIIRPENPNAVQHDNPGLF